MDVNKVLDDIVEWFKNPENLKALGMFAVVTVILAFDFAYWAGAIPTVDINVADGGEWEAPELESVNHTLSYDYLHEDSGSGGRIRTYQTTSFDMPEDGKLLMVNLTADGTHFGTDYDMRLEDPSGDMTSVGSSSANEAYKLDYTKKENKTIEAGTWTVYIDNYKMTLGTSWTLTAEAWLEVECGPDGCPI